MIHRLFDDDTTIARRPLISKMMSFSVLLFFCSLDVGRIHFYLFVILFISEEVTRRTMTTNPHNFVSIPAKKAFDVNVSTPIKNFIKATFGDKEDYSTSVDGFNALRAEALLRSNYRDDCSKLLRFVIDQ